MSSQATKSAPTTPKKRDTTKSQTEKGSISGQTIKDKKSAKEKAALIKHTSSAVVGVPPGQILKAAHAKKWSTTDGGKKSKRKKKHRRRISKRGGHCGKTINKINKLLKALKKEMRILERKQKSYYTKSKKLKNKINKKHVKTFKKLKLKLNKI
jgi:hypothetical protein